MGESLFAGAFGGGPRFPPRRQRRSAPPHAMPAGTAVVIRGLVGAAEHNGKTGRVDSFDAARSRYGVSIDGSITLSVRPQNLTQKCKVEVAGLAAKPALNGKGGDIVGYDSETERYVVFLQNPPSALSLQRKNCLLREGTRVVLTDLSSVRHNGQMACIVGVDKLAGRYVVRCQNGEEIKVRCEKVIC